MIGRSAEAKEEESQRISRRVGSARLRDDAILEARKRKRKGRTDSYVLRSTWCIGQLVLEKRTRKTRA
ncbi:hypothetical protein E2C01_056783 [Portunus trituberculatus]|uniref:Uncharacterized protein n=1 Tax=Portunus trituberculatus TaxID=210409 RepID=A0A5B7H1J5_PORTR|nr:hypothetical protein [Portunus trituberculatus]